MFIKWRSDVCTSHEQKPGRDDTRLSFPLRKISGPRGLLRHYILYKLSKKPMSGYELISDFDAVTGGTWHPGPGSIYPTLDGLRKSGLIEVVSRGHRSKQTYSLTRKGMKALDEDRTMINQFVPKWNKIRFALLGLISADTVSTIILETLRSNRPVWNNVIESREISKEEVSLRLKEYALLLNSELRWARGQLNSLQ